jgi:hypothetical protein
MTIHSLFKMKGLSSLLRAFLLLASHSKYSGAQAGPLQAGHLTLKPYDLGGVEGAGIEADGLGSSNARLIMGFNQPGLHLYQHYDWLHLLHLLLRHQPEETQTTGY